MEYEIFVEDNKQYLLIHVNGLVTDDLLTELIRKAAEKAHEAGVDKFLFDLRRATNQARTMTYWQVAYNLVKELGLEFSSKYALLVTPERIEDYRPLETFLLNASYQSKIFIDELEAREWIER